MVVERIVARWVLLAELAWLPLQCGRCVPFVKDSMSLRDGSVGVWERSPARRYCM